MAALWVPFPTPSLQAASCLPCPEPLRPVLLSAITCSLCFASITSRVFVCREAMSHESLASRSSYRHEEHDVMFLAASHVMCVCGLPCLLRTLEPPLWLLSYLFVSEGASSGPAPETPWRQAPAPEPHGGRECARAIRSHLGL